MQEPQWLYAVRQALNLLPGLGLDGGPIGFDSVWTGSKAGPWDQGIKTTGANKYMKEHDWGKWSP